MSRLKDLFNAAIDMKPEDRVAFLDRECAADPELRQRLGALLRAHDDPASVVDRPLVAPAASEPTGAYAPDSPPTGTFGDPQETADHTPMPDSGTLIAGKYKLLEEIGEGGMGTVWMADQTEPVKRRVAVKLIKAGMDSRAVLARFEAERQALALMDHPNIAKVLDAGATADGRPFFVMELVKGVPITKYCDDKRLTPRQRLELFVPVCQAIQHAHQKGVIHRDIKPSNVLIALYDDKPVPKVIDFGVAKAAGQPLTDRTLATGFGAVVGTPEYMSPEQASFNNLDIDTRSDVYALGVLLYELLAGAPPFSRLELEKIGLLEIFRVIREQEPPRPSTKLSTADALPTLSANRGTEPKRLKALIRGELDWIVMKALEKDRNRRYESANGFAADVQRYLAGEAVQAVPPSGAYRARKFVRKHRGPVTAAALVLLALVAGSVGTTVGLFRAEAAKQAEIQERMRAEQERDEKEKARAEAVEQRKHAEYQTASIGIDFDAKSVDPKLELLRLARRLPKIPDHAPELREYVLRRMLVLGEQIQSLFGNNTDFSSDGRYYLDHSGNATILRESFTRRQIAIWYGGASFVAEGRLILRHKGVSQPVELWNTAGQRVMSTGPIPYDNPQIVVSPDGKRVLTASNIAWFPGSFLNGSPHWKSETDKTNQNEIKRAQLWDGETGKLIEELSGYPDTRLQAVFSPDGRYLLTSNVTVLRVWSASDGRLIRELGRYADLVHDISFRPTGQSVAAICGNNLHQWQADTWSAKGAPEILPTGYWDRILWFDEILAVSVSTPVRVGIESVGIESYFFDTFICGHGSVTRQVAQIRPPLALLANGELYDLNKARLIRPQLDAAYPSEIEIFIDNNKLLLIGPKLYDAKSKKILCTLGSHAIILDETWKIVRDQYRLVLLPGPGTSGFHTKTCPLGPLPEAETTILWAQVIARGALGEDGEYLPWDERMWEANRQALLRSLTGSDAEIWLRPVARDSLFWLRQEIKSRSRSREEALPLINRLVATEPTWENYAARMGFYEDFKDDHLSIRDALEASRLAGVLIEPPSLNGYVDRVQNIASNPSRPPEHYQLALRWIECRRAAGVNEDPRTIALTLYRVGRFAEALSALRTEEEKGLPGQVGRAVLTGATATAVPLHGIAVSTQPENSLPQGEILHALRAMCHHKLGQPVLAQLHLDAAAAEQKLEDQFPLPGTGDPPDPRARMRREIPLYREAVELITGKPPTRREVNR